jgi:hypothetical protein
MATTKKKGAKKAAKPNGAVELKAYQAAIKNLNTAGSALARVANINKDLRSKHGVRAAVHGAQKVAAIIAKKIPPGPPGTTVFQ